MEVSSIGLELVSENYTAIPITQVNRECYVIYCQRYRFEHDESELYDEDLERFDPDFEKQPTYMLQNSKGELFGMASVRIMPFMEDQKRGRFSIFHVVEPKEEAYRLLWAAIERHLQPLEHVFLFIPEAKNEVTGILRRMEFQLDRFVWVLSRGEQPIESPQFPKGMSLRPYRGIEDAEDWCLVRNAAFQTLRGSETPIEVKDVEKMAQSEGSVPGGLMILSGADGPVGIIGVGKEVEEGTAYAFIGPVAVIPKLQGKGLGRQLLRAGVTFGQESGMPRAMLCVNADNDRAADLYLSEGFEKQVVMLCLKKRLQHAL